MRLSNFHVKFNSYNSICFLRYKLTKPKAKGREEFVSFDKNFPVKYQKKPWEGQPISKDEFFMRKYNNISVDERNKLRDKVERQKRAREMRKKNAKQEEMQSNPSHFRAYQDRNPRRSVSSLFRNPLNEYIYGTHATKAALSARKRILFGKLFLQNTKVNSNDIVELAKKYGMKVEKGLSKGELNTLCNNGVHNGVVLETRPLSLDPIYSLDACDALKGTYKVTLSNDLYDTNVPKELRVSRLVSSDKNYKYPLGIYLDGVTDPQNAGAIIRSAYYLGVDFIVLPESETASLGPAANKASAGALDLMTIFQTADPLKFVERSKSNGWNVISTSAHDSEVEEQELSRKHEKIETSLKAKFLDSSQLSEILIHTPILLVMGSESQGVRTNLKLRSDYLVGLNQRRLDHSPIVDSLNVSVACALLIEKCLQ